MIGIWPALVGASLITLAAAVDAPADLTHAIDVPIRAIIAAHQIEPPFDRVARRYAATYVYTIICRGVGVEGFRAAEAVMQADPKVPYQAAVLAILGIYVRAMPSGSNPAVCAKAFEDATRRE